LWNRPVDKPARAEGDDRRAFFYPDIPYHMLEQDA
jgi:hypothetical protein